MKTVKQVMVELKKKGDAQTRKTYARHGMPEDTFGVKIADLKLIAKKIKGNQALACELYETGNYDAMYLAGIVADGSQMTKKQLESWAKTATCAMLSEYTVPGVASESPHAQALAMKWIRSKTESIASSGWNTYTGIIATTPDEDLDLEEIKSLLDRVAREVHQAPNKVRYTMNGFVIAVGSYVKPLLKKAKQVAKKVGVVSVDMGDTACKVPQALTYIEKIESAGRVGKKRKTIKC
ncbi:DNA alkylation repair protein [Gimesia aquarii]|uniref:DNA alkylation repair enzyme n=1 Tax=Gimesia aquarii TaxID=2527964 RepID=A0A517W0F2_9PLAN|nr:DNA alkylation repair protein [Gimesia aquarii]QDT98729.1 DNA alkylation repair enzyme [Gimesia aquarii]